MSTDGDRCSLTEAIDGAGGSSAGPAKIKTGFDPLDSILGGGIDGGELAIVGGKPGVGKTIFVSQIAMAAARHGIDALFVSFEHTPDSMARRMVIAELATIADDRTSTARIDGRLAVRSHFDGLATQIPSPVAEAIRTASAYGKSLQLRRGRVGTTFDEVASWATAELADGGLLVVDYLQKITADPSSANTSHRAGIVAEALKQLALEVGISVVAVSAVTSSAIARRRVGFGDLDGGGELAHEADIVLTINEKALAVADSHRDFSTDRTAEFGRYSIVSLEKHRDGPAPAHMEFEKDFANLTFVTGGVFLTDRLTTAVT